MSRTVDEAIAYSLASGGKGIRRRLLSATYACVKHEALGTGNLFDAAVEHIHTYSLIHDDLPAMDDDDMRRGKPSCHVVYGEAIAILAGDALQAKAFELIADAPELSANQKVQMVKVLASAAGADGMVGGQAIDIESEGQSLTLDELRELHRLKTGALIRASVILGGIAAGASQQQLDALDRFADQIGLAFQVVDDALDVEGSTEALGKTQGKDQDADKATYVKLLGLEGAKAEAQNLLASALEALESFGSHADELRELAHFIVSRDR